MVPLPFLGYRSACGTLIIIGQWDTGQLVAPLFSRGYRLSYSPTVVSPTPLSLPECAFFAFLIEEKQNENKFFSISVAKKWGRQRDGAVRVLSGEGQI